MSFVVFYPATLLFLVLSAQIPNGIVDTFLFSFPLTFSCCYCENNLVKGIVPQLWIVMWCGKARTFWSDGSINPEYKVPYMPAPIVKALRCIHSGAAIRGPSALPFEVLWRCCARSLVETPGDNIQDQHFHVLGVYRTLRPKRTIPHPIAILNTIFDW